MGEAIKESMQEQLALAVVSKDLGIVEQIRALLTDQFWVVVGMMLIGMVVGIAFAGAARLFRWHLDKDMPVAEYKINARVLSKIAFTAGALWTAAILVYLIDAAVSVRVLMATGLGPIAGLGTPFMYDFGKWVMFTLAPKIGVWILESLKAKFGKNGQPPPAP